MSSIISLLNIVIIALAIWATYRKWGYRPWVFVVLPFFYGYYTSLQFDDYALYLMSPSFTDDTLSRRLDNYQISEMLSAYMTGYYAIHIGLQLCVIFILGYMVMHPRASFNQKQQTAQSKVDGLREKNPRDERISKLDELVASGMITPDERQSRIQEIDIDIAEKAEQATRRMTETKTAPFVRYFDGLRVLVDLGIITAEEHDFERKKALRILTNK